MGAVVEVWEQGVRALVPLEGDRVSIGRADGCLVQLGSDLSVSRVHAVIERMSGVWCVRDLSSRNGTYVNGERLFAERPLRHDDEIRVGAVRLIFRDAGVTVETLTEAAAPPPTLTARERDVLVALCEPVLAGDVFTEPSSTRRIAEQLGVTDAAVKQHLANLYDKFDIHDDGTGSRRRIRLANDAIQRGAVTVADLKA